MFERYTATAQNALRFARDEAYVQGSLLIEPEHVLLGIVCVGDDITSGIFAAAHLSADRLRQEITPHGPRQTGKETLLEFSGATKRALLHAADEADRMIHASALRRRWCTDQLGPEHQLLGLLRGPNRATSILLSHGIVLDLARENIAHAIQMRA
jgi:ATP-dependent Clp protease ATP-binding subunit ClpA